MTRAPHLDQVDVLAHANTAATAPSEHLLAAADHAEGPSSPLTAQPAGAGEETFVVPASLEQVRYWTLAQIDPGSTASNMAISCEVAGPLDPLLLEQAIAALTLRHEALRTVFRVVDGELSQIILTRPLYEFTRQDLFHANSSAASQPEIAAALSAHSHASIDLEHGPVLRARLLRIAPEQHVLALTMNHIVCDGWSNGLLLRDLVRIYEALRQGAGPLDQVAAGSASGLPELPFQFADFTVWQNEYLASDLAATALQFWTSHIPRGLPALDMPADHPRQGGRSFPGAIASALLPASLNDRLAAYCRSSGSTKHIVLLAVFQALCARFTGQRRFLLGSTIANRTQPGMEDVVGRFANPQIIVADVEGDPSFRELELRVREWETSAYTHQDLPFSRVVEELQREQGGAGSHFLQVWFVYQRAFMQPQQANGLTLTPLRSVSGGVDFDMLVSVVERAEGPRLQIEYNTDLFESKRIEALLSAFEQLLTGVLAQPEQPVSQVALGAAPAAAAIQAPTAAPTPAPNLLARIAAHATSHAHAAAVRAGSAELTWQTLEERSDALAAHLERERHLAGASDVLLVLTPEVESAVALLALLKLGPQGPRITPLPAHTNAAGLRSAATGNTLVLAPAALLEGLASATTRTVAFEGIVTLPVSAPSQKDDLPRFWAAPVIDHALSAPLLLSETLHAAVALADRLALTPSDALLAVTPASPSDALCDLLLAFASGATLDLIAFQPELALQPLLNERQSTVLIAEPALWRAWTAQGWSGDRRLTGLARGRHVAGLWSGPSFSSNDTPALRDAIAVLSAPAGAIATASRSSASASRGEFAVLPGVSLQVLDPDGRVVPVGATGELASTGAASTGYLAQATSSGAFRILGRSDAVVPLHGHRVQLGDLEGALLHTPGVLDAVALLETQPEGVPQLAAWIIKPPEVDVAALRRELLARLPQHLAPATLQAVAELPYRLDGSIHVAALPRPAAAATQVTPSPEEAAPLATDDLSRELSDIWKDVLNLMSVDPHLSFFDAGGNSLLLVRLFARINKAFGTRLPITTIFDAETMAKLSARLREQDEIHAMVPVQPLGHRPPVFMIHSYLLYQGLSQALGRTQPFYGLRELEADGELSMQQRVTNYVREIRAVQPHGPYSVMGWCAAGPLTVEVARQLLEAGESMASIILFDSWLPGYLSSVEGVRSNGSLAPKLHGIRSKLRRHSEKMRPLSVGQRLQYVRGAAARFVLNRRNRLFIQHWSLINTLANRFRLPLPQFMYNTTLTTFAALHAYRPQPVPARLTLIRAHDTREVPGASAACGWEQVAVHGVDVLWAPGDHETMFLGEKLEATAELIRRCLEHGNLRHGNLSGALPLAASAAPPPEARLLQLGSL